MFCSHCGTDCRDANFCPKCGREVGKGDAQQSFTARKKALQASGEVFCPKCLSTSVSLYREPSLRRYLPFVQGASAKLGVLMAWNHRSVLREEDGDLFVCLKCSFEWRTKAWARQERYNKIIAPLLGKYAKMNYPGLKGTCLQLQKDQIVIKLSEMKGCIIPLKELAAVEHCESSSYLCGMLSLRDRSHRRRSFPKKFAEGAKDRFSIIYDPHYRRAYCELFAALRLIVDENKKEGLF